MLRDISYPSSFEYKSASKNPPIKFFFDSLLESNRLDFLLGYFSTSSINVLSLGFATFIANGGTIRLVINEFLSVKDKRIVLHGLTSDENEFDFNIENIGKIKSSLTEYGQHFMECIAWLIASKRITIQAVKPREGIGISHYKSGVFYDDENTVKFKGSCNFTYGGLIENLEELDIKPSWVFGEDSTEAYKTYFEHILAGNNPDVELIDSENITEVFQSYGNKDLEDLLQDEKRLLKSSKKIKIYESISDVISLAEERIAAIQKKPKFPYDKPYEYQSDAYKDWVNNQHKGIFAMATGTGKTLTSLNCVLEEYCKMGNYRALILVPTRVLVDQWYEECGKFNFKNVVKVSSKEKWTDELSMNLSTSKFDENFSFIVIATYASFNRPKFQSRLRDFPDDVIFIADEAHNIGSPLTLKSIKKITLQKRIGLSATPERQYDEDGNNQINEFFNDQYPYVVSFSMRKAIEEKVLCKYYYYPHLVSLNEIEYEEYSRITGQLMKFFDSKTGSFKDDDRVGRLLICRKNIIHKAEGKKDVFDRIIKDELKKPSSLQFTLIYAPEGFEPDYSESDEYTESADDLKIIDHYTKLVSSSDPNLTVQQYSARLSSHDRLVALQNFSQGKTSVLISMKCLDEGVDVPRSETAIFCASTGNPRQFIQRRGRVLRTHLEKSFAYIHDLVVIPRLSSPMEPSYNMEKNLVRNELSRVVNFSFLSENKYHSFDQLKEVCDHYELSLFEIETDLENKHAI